ncbi:MAG: hypothetical protein ACREQQ_18765 [Candidatus Binatia bacterium]
MRTGGWLLGVAVLFVIGCGGDGGSDGETVSGTVVRPSSEVGTVAGNTVVECRDLGGSPVATFSSVSSAAGFYSVPISCAQGGAGTLQVPDADATTTQTNQLSRAEAEETAGAPLPLSALFDSRLGSVVKDIDGTTTIAERAAETLIAGGAITPDQITAEVIAILENAALSIEPRTNFRNPASVQSSADQVNAATANGTSPGVVPTPTPTRKPTKRPTNTPTPSLTDTPTPTPTAGTIACGTTTVSGGDTPESRIIELGTTSGTFGFSWEMFAVQDQMQVSYEGQPIFDTGCVSDSGQSSLTFSGSSTQIRVDVMPNCAGGTSTAWEFTVTCPTP